MFLEIDFALLAELNVTRRVISIRFNKACWAVEEGSVWNSKRCAFAYFPPKTQLLLLLLLRNLLLRKLLARDFALVEACEVFFARSGVEFDFLGDDDVNLAFLIWRRHGFELSVWTGGDVWLCTRFACLSLEVAIGKLLQGSGV